MPMSRARVSAYELSGFIAELRRLSREGYRDDGEKVAFFARKAEVLERIAAHNGSAESHEVAREARVTAEQVRAEIEGAA